MTERKSDQLLAKLQAGWCTVHELTVAFNVQNHSLRASISGIRKNHSVETKRVDGITSYSVAPAGMDAAG